MLILTPNRPAVAMKLYSKGPYSQGGRYETPGARYETPGSRYEEPYLMEDSRYPRSRHHRDRRSSSVSPLGFDDRDELRRGYASGGDYSDYDRDAEYSDYGRSPMMNPTPYRLGSPSVLTSALPGGVPIGGSYGRRRASSTSYHTRPPIPGYDSSALSTSPNIGGGALIVPQSSRHHHHSNSFGGYHNGLPVQTIMPGDPTSEYGHLPPGTYMVTGGSGRRKHRKSHSGARYVM